MSTPCSYTGRPYTLAVLPSAKAATQHATPARPRAQPPFAHYFIVTLEQVRRNSVQAQHVESDDGHIRFRTCAFHRSFQLQRDTPAGERQREKRSAILDLCSNAPAGNHRRAAAASVGQSVPVQRLQRGQPDEHTGVLPPTQHNVHGVQVKRMQRNIPKFIHKICNHFRTAVL